MEAARALRAAGEAGTASPLAYDEMYDERGQVRPQYAAILPIVQRLTAEDREKALAASQAYFEGENPLSPVPRVLTTAEAQRLARGVAQRGQALMMFLRDHYSGEKRYAQIISPERVDALIARGHEASYRGLIRPDTLSFPYGPDVMRSEDGRFYVLEDNLGYTGGPADLIKAREALYGTVPAYRDVLRPVDDPAAYFQALIARARERARPPDGAIAVYAPIQVSRDDRRLSGILRDAGAELVHHDSEKKLVCNEEGAFLASRGPDGTPVMERVGYLFLVGEHRWLDASHPATRSAYLEVQAELALARRAPQDPLHGRLLASLEPDPTTGQVDSARIEALLLETGDVTPDTLALCSRTPGLAQAVLEGKVAANYTPGCDFVGDKDFKGHVDDLVRFYLGQEPLLPSVPVTRFTRLGPGGQEILDPGTLAALLDDGAHARWVFKASRGRGGKGVYIGPKMTPEEVTELRARIAVDPGGWIAEPFKRLSTLDGHLVDLRLVATIDGERATVAQTPWGRGVPVDGDGKVNLSQNGKEFAVVTVAAERVPAASARMTSRTCCSPSTMSA